MARSGRAVLPDPADPDLSEPEEATPAGGGPPTRSPAGILAPLALVAVALAGPFLASCGASTTGATDQIERAADLDGARRRAVAVETGPCGSADPSRGSGLAIDDGLVLTAAHVVASGGPIEVVGADGPRPAELVAYDPGRDLALLAPRPPLPDVPAMATPGSLAEGESGTIVAAATSGDVAVTVAEVLVIEIDDVRSTTRSSRRGYLVDGATGPGDSGAGLYDRSGRLIGLLFAVSTDDGRRSWVTAASEIEDFLADDATRGTFVCDPDRSRVARSS